MQLFVLVIFLYTFFYENRQFFRVFLTNKCKNKLSPIYGFNLIIGIISNRDEKEGFIVQENSTKQNHLPRARGGHLLPLDCGRKQGHDSQACAVRASIC